MSNEGVNHIEQIKSQNVKKSAIICSFKINRYIEMLFANNIIYILNIYKYEQNEFQTVGFTFCMKIYLNKFTQM